MRDSFGIFLLIVYWVLVVAFLLAIVLVVRWFWRKRKTDSAVAEACDRAAERERVWHHRKDD